MNTQIAEPLLETSVRVGLPTKCVLKTDVLMPSDPVWGGRAGKVIPNGTVFYKCSDGAYRPWFHNGPECLALSDTNFVAE